MLERTRRAMIQGLNYDDAPVGNMDVRVSIDAVAGSSGIFELLGLLARAPCVGCTGC